MTITTIICDHCGSIYTSEELNELGDTVTCKYCKTETKVIFVLRKRR